MEEELLKELDSILNPAIHQSWSSATRTTLPGGDPRTAFLNNLKIQMDHTKVDLSKTMYKLDLAMQGCGTDVERAAAEVEDFCMPEDLEEPKIDERDYVRPTDNGFEVWNGSSWIEVSEKANIKVELYQNEENDNRHAVRVWAQDDNTGVGVMFVDNDIAAPGYDLGRSWSDFDDNIPVKKDLYWEDPFYNIGKNSVAVGGLTAGVLEMRHIGNMMPWRGSETAVKLAEGWYRTAKGKYKGLSLQRGFGNGAGGHQRGVQNAMKKANIFKSAGKVFFAVGVGFSTVEFGHAFYTQDINRNEVYKKAIVDIAIGYIGLVGGPVGWIIAGTYFILDASGTFGDWGRSKGISQNQFNQHLANKVQNAFGTHIHSLKFEVDFVNPYELQQTEMYLEERTVKKDKVSLALPKIIWRKD